MISRGRRLFWARPSQRPSCHLGAQREPGFPAGTDPALPQRCKRLIFASGDLVAHPGLTMQPTCRVMRSSLDVCIFRLRLGCLALISTHTHVGSRTGRAAQTSSEAGISFCTRTSKQRNEAPVAARQRKSQLDVAETTRLPRPCVLAVCDASWLNLLRASLQQAGHR